MLVTSIFSFFHNVFKGLFFFKVVNSSGLYGKGLIHNCFKFSPVYTIAVFEEGTRYFSPPLYFFRKVFKKGRKICGQKRNRFIGAISPFPTVFSKTCSSDTSLWKRVKKKEEQKIRERERERERGGTNRRNYSVAISDVPFKYRFIQV